MDVDESGAVVAPPSDDDGYVSPEFNLPDPSSEDEEHWQTAPPPPKRSKISNPKSERYPSPLDDLEADEELALQLLRRK